MKLSKHISPIANLLCDLGLVFVIYLICRIIFIWENYDLVAGTGDAQWSTIFKGGMLFDISAILYTNILFIALALIPCHFKETKAVAIAEKWIFLIINSAGIIANLADSVYFQFTQRRTTVAVFHEFGNETNMLQIVGAEFINHWYLVLAAAALIAIMAWLYRNPIGIAKGESLKRYYTTHIIALAIGVPLMICGMRGYWFHQSSRPLAVAYAYQYAKTPAQAGAVLNTPFSIFRTAWGKKYLNIPQFFSHEKLAGIYTTLHTPADSVAPNKKNVVILIVESFAQEFVGALNTGLDNGTYKGYTTFADSLLRHSVTFDDTFCNGYVSIDAMPAILSSLPKVQNSFILSPYASNDIPGIAKYLNDWGYHSAFFHGGINSSMGFQAVARSAGFKEYYGMDEYVADPRFGGKDDFDGTWAIWDEEFLQYFATILSEMPQPFVGSVFTATSHHPFRIPDRYKDVYKDEGLYELHKCIRYTDNALRRFFDTARKQPWFDNTIFVLTADHASSKVTHDEYKTELGHFRVPIIIYDPSGDLEPGMRPGVMQHIDIMPTLLDYLGYDRPYHAVGKDAFTTAPEESWAMNFHNVPQYITPTYLMQLNDDFTVRSVYDYKADPLLKNDIKGSAPQQAMMEDHIKAILQAYDEAMKSNTMK